MPSKSHETIPLKQRFLIFKIKKKVGQNPQPVPSDIPETPTDFFVVAQCIAYSLRNDHFNTKNTQ
jgi:hypothetical protein